MEFTSQFDNLTQLLSELKKKLTSERFILVLDEHTRLVVSLVCGKYELFDSGCVANERDQVPAMDVIYFVRPTDENIDLINKDFSVRYAKVSGDEKLLYCGMSNVPVTILLYDRIYLYFTSPLSDDQMQKIKENELISDKIIDMGVIDMDFIVLEPQLFSLGDKDALSVLFANGNSDEIKTKKKEMISKISDQLVSVCLSLKEFPHIRYSKQNPSELVAKEFQVKMNAYLHDHPDFNYIGKDTKKNQGIQQGTLFIVDRKLDMVVPFIHDITYQGLLYDLIGVSDEKEYEYESELGSGEVIKKKIILDYKDKLWMEHRLEMFQLAHTNIREELKEFSAKKDELRAKADENLENANAFAKKLADIVKQSDILVQHFKTTQKIWNMYKEKYTKLFELEHAIASGVDEEANEITWEKSIKEISELFENEGVMFSVEEKIRLIATFCAAIKQKNADLSDIKEIERTGGIGTNGNAIIRNLNIMGVETGIGLPIKADDRKNRIKRAKDLVKKSQYIHNRYDPVLKDIVIEQIEGKLNQSMYPYLGVIPQAPTNRKQGRISLRTHRARNVKKEEVETKGNRLIVFMIGGISQYEIRCLYEIALRYRIELIVGSTDLPSPNKFLDNILDLDRPTD